MSSHTGVIIPLEENLLIHLNGVKEVQSFCIHLQLPLEDCHMITRENTGDLESQKIAVLKKWQDKSLRTWKRFIRSFALLGYCVKAKELSIEHSVYFMKSKDDNEVLKICSNINNRE